MSNATSIAAGAPTASVVMRPVVEMARAPVSASETRRGVVSRFGSFAAPIAAIAAMAAPAHSGVVRWTYSKALGSASGAADMPWAIPSDGYHGWAPSQAYVARAEIDELNALFNMAARAVGGVELESPDA